MMDTKAEKKIIVLSWAGVAAWMAVIFLFSSQTGESSGNLSGWFRDLILQLLKKPEAAETVHFLVRKGAHAGVYLVLGGLSCNALFRSGIRGMRGLLLGIFICFLYAVSDEVHQLFVAERAGQFQDVLIDTCGAAFGNFIIYRAFRLK